MGPIGAQTSLPAEYRKTFTFCGAKKARWKFSALFQVDGR